MVQQTIQYEIWNMERKKKRKAWVLTRGYMSMNLNLLNKKINIMKNNFNSKIDENQPENTNIKKIDLAFLSVDIYVSFNDNIEVLKNTFESKIDWDKFELMDFVLRDTHDNILIRFTYCDDAIIVHECTHAANDIFSILKIKHDPDNDEIYAYLVEYLFSECKRIQKDIKEGRK